jgi:hypothetical protein
VELTGFSDSAISTLLLDDNRYAGDLNKFTLGDFLFIEGLMQLLCRLIKRHHVVPGCLAATFRVDRKWKASCWTVLPGCKPRITAQMAAERYLLYSLAWLWRCTITRRACSRL